MWYTLCNKMWSKWTYKTAVPRKCNENWVDLQLAISGESDLIYKSRRKSRFSFQTCGNTLDELFEGQMIKQIESGVFLFVWKEKLRQHRPFVKRTGQPFAISRGLIQVIGAWTVPITTYLRFDDESTNWKIFIVKKSHCHFKKTINN